MYTFEQILEALQRSIRVLVKKLIREEGCLNSLMTSDGVIDSVRADNKVVSVFINGERTATPGVLNPLELTLSPGLEVVLFNRSPHDRIVLYPKIKSQ